MKRPVSPFALSLSKGLWRVKGLRQAQPERGVSDRTELLSPFALNLSKGLLALRRASTSSARTEGWFAHKR
jgi:hypothetical protein